MKETFIDVNFRQSSLDQIELCNRIIRQYQGQGFRLTLRQLYYQLVSRDIIPNTERSYKNLGKLISQGRLAGMVDWNAIEDRLRAPHKITEWDTPADIMDAVVSQYRLPRWGDQEYHVELWCEKDALAGVLRPLADEYHLTMMVNRGYSSQSAMKEAAERIYGAWNRQRVILYIGDLDPSGEDMVRDIRERLDLLSEHVGADVIKLAITEEQVAQYNPPPNPAKMSDSRAAGFVDKFGTSSYEADALEPNVLAQVIRDAVVPYIDWTLWEAVGDQEERDKELLNEARDRVMGERDGDDESDGTE